MTPGQEQRSAEEFQAERKEFGSSVTADFRERRAWVSDNTRPEEVGMWRFKRRKRRG